MPDADPPVAALRQLIDEVRALFHVLKAAAERIHGEGERSAARRGALLGLAKTGPQTVPQMARSRPVSRQHIQVVVNGLIGDGLVELAPNPAHRRSRLGCLTANGHARVRELIDREIVVLGRLDVGASQAELMQAATTLGAVRGAFSRLALDEAPERTTAKGS